MAAKRTQEKREMIAFTHEGHEFEADKAMLSDYETNKMFAAGGDAFFVAAERVFDGRDVEYSKVLGGDFDCMVGLVNAAYKAVKEAKN